MGSRDDGKKYFSADEISRHCKPEDVWIVVGGKVYDVTEFTPTHPGGAGVILRYAGADATQAYDEVHAPSVITDTLPANNCLGVLDETTVTADWAKPPPTETKELAIEGTKPPLGTLINCDDFERVAATTLSKKTWAFYDSAATDLITKHANRSALDEIFFRPRILRNVRTVSTRTRILDCETDMPIFVSPAAMAKLVHPDGEKELARGAGRKDVVQCISSNASFPIAEIVKSSTISNQPFFFQLYVNKDRAKSEVLLKQVSDLGVRALFVTVDAPVPGKREADERVKADEGLTAPMTGGRASNDAKGGGMGRLMGSYIDSTMSWHDLAWIRSCTDLPIILKGIQTAADARLALEYGVDGILLSNHGGRSLDTSPPAVLILLELHRCCPEVFDAMEVFVDGGIRRGTDILKCLCLGATAVGIGRPFLYALNYGQEGVMHLIDTLKDELETTMRTAGLTDLSQVHPGLVNTLRVDHLVPSGFEHPYAKWRPKSRL
ncbi:MAG: hypothetical protein M4579_001184 [Chaenotheca gracillima]|nr:MAG: hypothetical protein M4579_001184 [Chaenotheca gracillima]